MENNKLTPKQRAKIYLKASEEIDKNKYNYSCEALQKIGKIKRRDYSYSEMLQNFFPEFYLFKPSEDIESWRLWFDNKNTERIIALLFAYQMALDAKE